MRTLVRVGADWSAAEDRPMTPAETRSAVRELGLTDTQSARLVVQLALDDAEQFDDPEAVLAGWCRGWLSGEDRTPEAALVAYRETVTVPGELATRLVAGLDSVEGLRDRAVFWAAETSRRDDVVELARRVMAEEV